MRFVTAEFIEILKTGPGIATAVIRKYSCKLT